MNAKSLVLAGWLACLALPAGAAGNEDPDRLERWADLAAMVFGDDVVVAPTETLVTLDAPKRAMDAAFVPVSITTAPDAGVTGLALVVDDNPGPVAARVHFGPAGDPRALGLRVRVDGYTNVHAAATLANGSVVANAVFVKAAGGCSAPITMSDGEAMAGMGEMRMKFGGDAPAGTARATLMVRHPNFNGMQMNQVTMLFTPPRFVSSIEIWRGEALVLALESDISLSTDPVIDFLYHPVSNDPFTVTVADTKGERWTQDFVPPEMTN